MRTATDQVPIQEIKEFEDFFNGSGNFMTPDPVDFVKKGEYIIEISKGKGFDRRTIYGVTVLERINGVLKRPERSLSGMCESWAEIDDKIKEI